VNDLCSHLSAQFPGLSFSARQRTSLAVALQSAGATADDVSRAGLVLSSKEYVTESARYMKTVPASDILRCIEEMDSLSAGSRVDADARMRLLHQGADPEDFQKAEINRTTKQVEKWLYVPRKTDASNTPSLTAASAHDE